MPIDFKKESFEIGDKVLCVKEIYCYPQFVGKIGTITRTGNYDIRVEFDGMNCRLWVLKEDENVVNVNHLFKN